MVVVDATFLKHLADPKSAEQLRRLLRMCHLRIWPSKINALEVIKDPSKPRRDRLAEAIRDWCGRSPLLPWPPQLLQVAGEAALRGETKFLLPSDLHEFFVPDGSDIVEDREKAELFVKESEAAFADTYASVRKEAQAILKTNDWKTRWPTAREFLAEEWCTDANLMDLSRKLWTHLELPGAPPASLLTISEAWRLATEVLGTAMYDRAISPEQAKNPPGIMDLLQVVYLSMHTAARVFELAPI